MTLEERIKSALDKCAMSGWRLAVLQTEIACVAKAAVEEDRKSRECCKAEQEACAGIVAMARKECAEINATTPEEKAFKEGAVYITGAIERAIRFSDIRSQSLAPDLKAKIIAKIEARPEKGD
jgi:hypothetical protein